VLVITSIKNFQLVVGRNAPDAPPNDDAAPNGDAPPAADAAPADAAGDGDDECDAIDDGGDIVLQHRKVGADAFDLDVAEPLSPFVAFALVLAHSFGPH
jgi:hypothetical protein